MKILFVSSELSPLAKSGGLGDVVAALPKALRRAGHDARVIIPLYKQIKDRYCDKMNFLRWSMTKLGWRNMYGGLFSTEVDGVPVYFIDNEFYFGHEQLYVEYNFDIERFSFFQRAVLDNLGEAMDFYPDILHLNDWQAGMVPVLLEAHYKSHGYHRDLQCLLTIHNLKFQGIHGRERIQDLMELPDRYFSEARILKDGVPNFLKSGILYSNRVTTVSPTYAKEIMMDFYGEGLNGILGAQSWKLSGILNGIDVEVWNPQTDPLIAKNYNVRTWKSGKAANKEALQKELGLPVRPDVPLIAMVSRLSSQKGLDLLMRIMDELLNEDVQFVLLGTGDREYEQGMSEIGFRHPENSRMLIKFSDELSHRIYASSDLFLMPSIFEPCGLSQMISMRYGCLPLVRETGGLVDTVKPYNEFEGTGTGFRFANINAHELLYTAKNACALYRDNRTVFNKLVKAAMEEDFSWDRSALQYVQLYEDIIKETKHAL